MQKIRKPLSILLSFVLILSVFTIIPVTTANAAGLGWHEVSLDDIEDGDTIIVTMQTGDGYYGLSCQNGGSVAPDAVAIDYVSNADATQEKLIGAEEDLAACTWTVGRNGDVLTFSASGGEMLYCTDADNGLRVMADGDDDQKLFTVEDNYLYNDATKRYLGVYNKQQWRAYTDHFSGSSNIRNQYVVFWSYSEDVGTYDNSDDDHSIETMTYCEGTAPTYDPVSNTYTSGVMEHYDCPECGGHFVFEDGQPVSKTDEELVLLYFRFRSVTVAGYDLCDIIEYNGADENVVIPDTVPADYPDETQVGNTVTGIDYGAFKGKTSVETVTAGDSLRGIYESAFEGCTSLTTVTVGSSLSHIGKDAFKGCTALESFTSSSKEYITYSHIEIPEEPEHNAYSFDTDTAVDFYGPHGSGLYAIAKDFGCDFYATDRHREPTWTWAADYSSATAHFDCDPFCPFNEAVTTTEVASEQTESGTVYTTFVAVDGETYNGSTRVSYWKQLQAQIDALPDGNQNANIRLEHDMIADVDDTALVIPAGKKLTLVLDGHTINRNLEQAAENGHVITNNGNLTMIGADSGANTITGGNSTTNGGAILNNGTLQLNKVTISGNTTTADGGAVYNSGRLTVFSSIISGNSAGRTESGVPHGCGGAISAHSGTINITSDTLIQNNTAANHGGAIYIKDATLNLGDCLITGNTAGNQGGGICDVGTLNIESEPVVKENTAPNGNNIYLRPDSIINVTGELRDKWKLGITREDNVTDVITEGLWENGRCEDVADHVFSDHPDYYIEVNENSEAELYRYYVFTFEANGGSGTQETVRNAENTAELPPCTLEAPEGMAFKAWSVDGEEKQPGETVEITEGYSMTVTAVWAQLYQISPYIYGNGTLSTDKTQAFAGETITVTATPDEGWEIQTIIPYYDSTYLRMDGDTFVMPEHDVTVYVRFDEKTPYIDEDGSEQSVLASKITSDLGGVYSGGWYAVKEDVAIDHSVYFGGDLRLILCDGATLTFTNGGAISLGENGSLTIYGQKNGTGKIRTVNENYGNPYMVKNYIRRADTDPLNVGDTTTTLTLNGGVFEAEPFTLLEAGNVVVNGGSIKNCDLYAYGDLTVNGGSIVADVYESVRCVLHSMLCAVNGTVSVTGGTLRTATDLDGISASIIRVTGGTVELDSADRSGIRSLDRNPVHLSWTNLDDVFRSNFFWTGQGQADVILEKDFVDENGNILRAGTYEGQNLTDKTLRPYDGMGVQLAGHSISLDGDVAVNFYMELTPEIVAHDAYMQFTVPDTSAEYQSQKVYVRDLTPTVVDGKTYYIFKCRVAAKDMDSEIRAQLIDGEDSSIVYTYSVRKYADYLLAHLDVPAYAAAEELVSAMLTYGDHAKYYFGGGAKPADLDTVIPELSSVVADAAQELFDGATLSLKSKTTLSLYFKSAEPITLSIEGKEAGVDYEVANAGSEYVIRIRDIAVSDLDKPVTVQVNGEDAVTYSPLTYCSRAQASDDTKLTNTVRALYRYWKAAEAYFPQT